MSNVAAGLAAMAGPWTRLRALSGEQNYELYIYNYDPSTKPQTGFSWKKRTCPLVDEEHTCLAAEEDVFLLKQDQKKYNAFNAMSMT